MAGYSKTPLARKLGIKAGHTVLLRYAPDGFLGGDLAALPDGVAVITEAGGRTPDVAVVFSKEAAVLEREVGELRDVIDVDGGLWLAWPKKASKVPTDLSFLVAQGIGLQAGLVDNKSCAVTEIWSGVRFCFRKADRAAERARRG